MCSRCPNTTATPGPKPAGSMRRRGAPDAAAWQGTTDVVPGFVLNLPAFVEPGAGFALADFAAAVDTAVVALSLAAPESRRIAVRVADLAGLLAVLGIDYGSSEARDVARSLAALLRGCADSASARLARGVPPVARVVWPSPPAATVLPGLAEAAAAAAEAARRGPGG